MKDIFRKLYLLFGLLISIFIVGCYSELSNLEVGNFQWSPELGVPLVDSEFNLRDLLEADTDFFDYTTDEENTVIITISDDSLFNQPATDYFSLNDESISVPSFILSPDEISLFNANGQVTVNREVNVDYPQPAGLTDILISQGTITIQAEENFPALINLSIGLRDPFGTTILDYGNNFNYVTNGDPVSSDQASSTYNNIRFIYENDPALRQVSLNFNIVLTRVDQDLVFGENALDLFLSFTNQEFDALFGDLSPQEINIEDNTIQTDFFNQDGVLTDLEYEFANPQFKMIFKNSMGLPVRFDVSNFTTYRDGQATIEPINDAVNMEAATEEGSVNTTENSFDDIFKRMINNVPDSVTLSIDGAIDPLNVPDNFIFKDSYIQGGYEIEIPLELRLSGLEIKETISLGGIDPQGLQYALFKFTSENSLPIDLNFRADFLDADSTVVYTLFDGKFLAGGTIAIPENISDIIRLQDEDDLDRLQNVDRVGIVATLSTTNGGNEMVKISSDAKVKFNLAVQTKYNLTLD